MFKQTSAESTSQRVTVRHVTGSDASHMYELFSISSNSLNITIHDLSFHYMKKFLQLQTFPEVLVVASWSTRGLIKV